MKCFSRKLAVWPKKTFYEKTPQNGLFSDTWLWKALDVKPLTPGQVLGNWVMWKVGGIKVKCTRKLAKRRIFWCNAPYPKIGGVSLFRNTANGSQQILKRGSTSAGHNSALNTPYPPLAYIFWTPWTRGSGTTWFLGYFRRFLSSGAQIT